MKKYIDEFVLTNIKRHKELAAKVNGKHFLLVGANGAGKTTVFQMIRRLIASLPDTEKPEIWLTQGAAEGAGRLVLVSNGDTYVVEEKIKKGTRSRIKLWRYSNDKRDELTPAQERIKEIFGQVMDFTPLMDMKGTDQFDYLRNLLNIDISGYASQRQSYYDLRTKEGQLRDVAKSAILNPDTRVTDSDKLAYTTTKEVADILKKRKDESAAKIAVDEAEKKIRGTSLLDADIKNLQDEIARLQRTLEVKLKEREELKKINLTQLKAAYQKIVDDNKAVDDEIKTVTDHNEMVRKVKSYIELEDTIKVHSANYNDYTEKIKALDKALNTRLAELPFGEVYPGLKLYYQQKTEDAPDKIGLFLDELPFHRNQLSLGNMIKAIIKLSVYLNPEGLSFIYIGQWDLLDKTNQNDILKFAEANENVQLGIEKVSEKTQIAVEFINVE